MPGSKNLYLINNLENIVIFQGFEVFFFQIINICFPAAEMRKSLCRETKMKNNLCFRKEIKIIPNLEFL